LARKGVNVTVFEALPDRAVDLRASTIHPPTMEMLDTLGVMPQLLAQGLHSPYWQFRDRQTGPVAVFDLSLLKDEVRFPFRLQCEQFKVTAALAAELAKYSHASLRFNARAIRVEQGSAGVTLVLSQDGQEVRATGDYLIAADGAGSAIRKDLGIEFEGFTYPERFLLISTPYEFREVMPDLNLSNYFSDPKEWLVMLRVQEFWRLLFPTVQGESDVDVLAEARLQARLRSVAGHGEPLPIVHKTLYSVHQRVAESYRADRVLLVGDAGHINNPLGGMGMNGGIHDAMNLVEKLAQVLEGGDEGLLDLYSRQRRAVAMDYVQQWTHRNRQILQETDPKVRLANLDELKSIASDPIRAKPYLRKTSMMASLELARSIA
jgi:3-(3-hydroxy-phenyl)propionate hydroxylase